MQFIGFSCVAIASVFSSATQIFLLIRYCNKKMSELKLLTETVKDSVKYLLGIVFMMLCIYILQLLNLLNYSHFTKLISYIVCGGIAYGIILLTLNTQIKKTSIKTRSNINEENSQNESKFL